MRALVGPAVFALLALWAGCTAQRVQFLVDRSLRRDKILAGLPFYGKQFADGRKREVRHIAWRDRQPGQAHVLFETPELAER